MTKEINYDLGGQFKCDLYKNGKLESSTDYFSNFITQTGMAFPSVYPFADCFRYLSIGRSAIANSGSTSLGDYGTTGLADPIGTFRDSNGINQSANHINWRGYVTGGDNPACGTVVTEGSPRFYRAWYIPTGNDPTITMNEPSAEGLTIGEFMVSPDSGNSAGGKAFSRVVRNLFIPNGYRAVISYQLRVKINDTGIRTFSGNSFTTGNADGTYDQELLNGWANLSGYYRQVYHGLRCVDSYGVTYIPKMGDGMEPSTKNNASMAWYLSPDNSQFDVNNGTGLAGLQASVSESYRSDGLMSAVKTLDLRNLVSNTSVSNSNTKTDLTQYYHPSNPTITTLPTQVVPTNIRLGKSSTTATEYLIPPNVQNYKVVDLAVPSRYNYQTEQDPSKYNISYATPGATGYRSDLADFNERAVFSSFTSTLPLSRTGQNTITGRKKTIVRRSVFAPISSLGWNTRFGSMVYGYKNGGTTLGTRVYYPNIDVLFYDSSGRAMMPHYRYLSGFSPAFHSGSGIIQASGYLYNSTGRFTDYFKTLQTGNTSSTYGSTNAAGNLTLFGEVYSGWGGVTGLPTMIRNSGNVALADHSLSALTEPEATGQLYWPFVKESNKLYLGFTGMKYYDPSVSGGNLSGIVTDSGNWFDTTHQIIARTDFTIYKDSIPTGAITIYSGASSSGVRYFVNPNTTPYAKTNLQGYYLTTKQFTGRFAGEDFNNILRYADVGTYPVTGYFFPKSQAIPSKLSGTIWLDQGNNPTNSNFFTVPTVSRSLDFNGNSYARVENLYSTITNRGFTFGTGGTPIRANDGLAIYFTGVSGANPLYLSYLFFTTGDVTTYRDCAAPLQFDYAPGVGLPSCPAGYTVSDAITWAAYQGGNLTACACYKDISTALTGSGAYSIMSGTLTTTTFARPSGYVTHSENATNSAGVASSSVGWRLNPNYNFPTTGGGIPQVNYGGSLPALSQDNGLTIDLAISISSPCGTAANCLEPI